MEVEGMNVEYAAGPERQPGAWSNLRQPPPGPGDLGRRAARRREELGLNRRQVADRAGMSVLYLEYLEGHPARLTGDALMRLADALRTTPSALLGAGADLPPGRRGPADHPALQGLSPAECRSLLAPGGIGRVAFATPSGLAVLPVNFAMAGANIVFRTGPDTVLAAHGDEEVGFEVDHLDEALAQGWSVLVAGPARRVVRPAELRALKANVAIWPWAGGDREIYVCIVPKQVTGRRIVADGSTAGGG
jgi:transcriptional regulator with XRE-family HTH domain